MVSVRSLIKGVIVAELLPTMFVGSSSEAKEVADMVCWALRRVAAAITWDDAPHFRPMESTMTALRMAAEDFDFGLFILAPDDLTISRGRRTASVRDNVLFEYGLFLGVLGPKRTFAIIESNDIRVKVPSDLCGMIIPRYTKGDEIRMTASMKEAVRLIKKGIGEEGRNYNRWRVLNGYSYSHAGAKFSITVSAARINERYDKFRGQSLVVVARKASDNEFFLSDQCIALGIPLPIPTDQGERERDWPLEAVNTEILGDISAGERVEGYLLLIPDPKILRGTKTVAQMIARGADVVGFGGLTRSK